MVAITMLFLKKKQIHLLKPYNQNIQKQNLKFCHCNVILEKPGLRDVE